VDEKQLTAKGMGKEEYLFTDWHKDLKVVPENIAPTNARIEIKFMCDTLPEHFYQLDTMTNF